MAGGTHHITIIGLMIQSDVNIEWMANFLQNKILDLY